jgi:putative ABC transport system permease protein
LIFGLLPALHSSRDDIGKGVGSGTRGTPRHIERKRGLLIIMEIGLALVLLVGAGLLSKSMIRLQSTPTGLRPDHLLTMRVTLSHSRYPTVSTQNIFFDQILSKIRDLPGVLGAGEISDTPLKGNNPTFEFVLDGQIHRSSDPPSQAGLRLISTRYLQTAGIPLLQGRDFTGGDRIEAPPVAIINQAMAHRYWPGSNPIGRRLRVKDEQQWITIAGLVPDVKHMGLKEEEGPVVYIPYAQKSQDWLAWTTLVIRTSGEPTSLVPAVRSVIRDLDGSQPVSEISTLEEVLAKATAVPRFSASISSVMAGLALLIAVIGVYGLLAYTIAQRFSELSIRLALGASPVNVSLLLIRQSMLRVLAGVAVGLPRRGSWQNTPKAFSLESSLMIRTSLSEFPLSW